ncbi:MAG TPA: hypothetical protein VGG39_05210 [Polyangiaceae bacterium]|jgi:hypothetical protein
MKKHTATATKNITALVAVAPTTPPTPPVPNAGQQCVLDACRGDRGAIGWIAIVMGGILFDEIVDELGEEGRQDASDAMQDFYLALCEARLLPPEPDDAIPWLGRMARECARQARLKGGAR